jgi:hypothetical protein
VSKKKREREREREKILKLQVLKDVIRFNVISASGFLESFWRLFGLKFNLKEEGS